jgi:hypothetical protein
VYWIGKTARIGRSTARHRDFVIPAAAGIQIRRPFDMLRRQPVWIGCAAAGRKENREGFVSGANRSGNVGNSLPSKADGVHRPRDFLDIVARPVLPEWDEPCEALHFLHFTGKNPPNQRPPFSPSPNRL